MTDTLQDQINIEWTLRTRDGGWRALIRSPRWSGPTLLLPTGSHI